MSNKLKPCPICGRIPKIVETYDTLQIVCDCGKCGVMYDGDYYDEGQMRETYEAMAIEEWNGELLED